MAKAPSSKVSKTSGQGISRKSYQTGYALRNKSDASVPKADGPNISDLKGGGGGGKNKYEKSGGMNISYGRTIYPSDLEDVQGHLKDAPRKGLDLTLQKPKSYKK